METWVLAFRYLVGFIFVLAGVPKLLASAQFERAIHGYALTPPRWARPLSIWLPRCELAAGLALLSGVAVPYVAVLLAVVLLTFGTAVAVNLLRGREIDCGCFGGGAARKVTWLAVVRNAVLAAMAIAVATDASAAVFGGLSGGRAAISSADSAAILVAATACVPIALLSSEWLRFSRSASAVAALANEQRR